MTVAYSALDGRLAALGRESERKDLHDTVDAQRVTLTTRIADVAALVVLNAASRAAAVSAGSDAPTLAAIDATTTALNTLSTNLTTLRTAHAY